MFDELANTQDFWLGSIHESAHAVAALALGGTCKSLSLHPEGRGLAILDGLSPFDFAVATAAAGHAEELLADEPVPRRQEPVPPRHETRDSDSVPTASLEILAARYPLKTAASDAQVVARFCIAGLETSPERWPQRFYTIHAVAHRIVEDHRAKILSVARALFARGILSEPDIRMEFEKS